MFGERIKEIRNNNNMTQQQFADVMNITRTTVCNWENNTSKPDPNQIVEISERFNVSTDYLFNVNIDKFLMIKKLMKDLGMMAGEDLTEEEFKKALEIINILKK